MSAIYPGSFDPVTNGHINLARRGAKVMGRLIIAVLDNPHKQPLFSTRERVEMLKGVFSRDENIEIDSFSGLLIDYAHKRGVYTIIRGLRGPEDLARELPYATWNKQLSQRLAQNVETLYFTAEPQLQHISSSVVKEIAAHVYPGGYDDTIIAQAVPPAAQAALKLKFT